MTQIEDSIIKRNDKINGIIEKGEIMIERSKGIMDQSGEMIDKSKEMMDYYKIKTDSFLDKWHSLIDEAIELMWWCKGLLFVLILLVLVCSVVFLVKL